MPFAYDPETGQTTDGFGLVVESDLGVASPLRSPLTRGAEESGSAPNPLSETPAKSRKEDIPYSSSQE